MRRKLLIPVISSLFFLQGLFAEEITLFYTNDLHAHVNPWINTVVDKSRPVGGFATIAGIVNQAKQNDKNVFFFDAGDYFTGPYISILTKGEAIVDILNTMPYDAVSVGNHEFDHGTPNMVAQLAKITNFPVLLNNVYYKNSDKRVIDRPWTIIEKNNLKIGVIGMHSRFAFYDTIAAKMIEDVEARDEVPELKQSIAELKAKHVDLIVLLAHEGVPGRQSSFGNSDVARLLQADIDTAKKVDGIDVLITGHAHVGTPVPLKANNTLIVSTDAYATDLGKLVLNFNPETKKIESYNGKLITLFADQYKPDPNVQKEIDKWEKKLKTITSQVIGHSANVLTRSYGESSPLGNLMLDATMAQSTDAVVGFQNSGGLRADIPKGEVTFGDVISTYPFNDELVEMDLTGKDLISLMIHATNLTNGALQVSKNVKVTYSSKKPLNERIISFTIDGKSIQDSKTYRVVTNYFCASGGDGYQAFVTGKNRKTIPGSSNSGALISYFKEHDIVTPDETKRVTDIANTNSKN
ncbi:TPA: bifunctional metallophosphatase/5'-nucleotidase [Escherichia albertii]